MALYRHISSGPPCTHNADTVLRAITGIFTTNIYKRRLSSVVENSSANPKVPKSISDPFSYRGHGL